MATIRTKASLGQKPITLPEHAQPQWAAVDVEFPSTAFVANDLIRLCELPPQVKVLDYAFIMPDVDSNGAPTWAFSFGEENAGGTDLATVYVAGVTAGQSNAIVRNTNSDAAQRPVTDTRKLALKVTTAAATYAGATKTGQVLLLLQG